MRSKIIFQNWHFILIGNSYSDTLLAIVHTPSRIYLQPEYKRVAIPKFDKNDEKLLLQRNFQL